MTDKELGRLLCPSCDKQLEFSLSRREGYPLISLVCNQCHMAFLHNAPWITGFPPANMKVYSTQNLNDTSFNLVPGDKGGEVV
jgi:hypothetical protein